MSTPSITEIATELRRIFPSLDDEKILEYTMRRVLGERETRQDITVAEVLEGVRAKFMIEETLRIRVRKQADNTVRIQDTSTYRHYETHWRRLEAKYGNRSISSLTAKNIKDLATEARTQAQKTNANRNLARAAKGFVPREYTGNTSYNSALNAFSAVMAYAVDETYIPENFVSKIPTRKKSRGRRIALTHTELVEVMSVVASGGNDPELDYLLLWALCETAGRRGGLVKLLVGDLETHGGINFLHLYEKEDKNRLQPVSEELSSALLAFAASRGSIGNQDPVFRYKYDSPGHGRALTDKRFETLWARIHKELPWTDERGVSSHWLRHTTLTWVGRAFGASVAKGYAGHGSANVTDDYLKSSDAEIIQAHSALIGKQIQNDQG